MFRRLRFVITLALMASVAACADRTDNESREIQSESENLRREFNHLRDSLDAWADRVYEWQRRTYEEICRWHGNSGQNPYCFDTPPDVVQPTPLGGEGEPDEPPEWGLENVDTSEDESNQ